MTTQIVFPPIPRRLGVAADLNFIVSSPIGFFADALLVYDQLVIPGEPMTLSNLYLQMGPDQIGRLLKARKLVFCPAMSSYLSERSPEFTRSRYVSRVEKELHLFDSGEQREALKQINEHLLVGPSPNYLSWREIANDANAAFIHAAQRPGYEFLQPIDRRTGMLNHDRQVGLRTGLARMNDLVAAGVQDMEMDRELPILLDICFPAKVDRCVSNTPESDTLKTIENLHHIRNLPAPGLIVSRENWPAERMVDLVLSDDAEELRSWFKTNVAPGMDVRDAYARTLEGLPSKKNWIGWLKFGSVSAVTTTIGALASPEVGAVAGLAIGAIDQKWGSKALEYADTYHPKDWLSLAERGYQR